MLADDTEPSDRRLIFRGLGLAAVGYPINTGCVFASQALTAHLLTQADFGTFSLSLSIMTVGALVAQLGLPFSLLRRASTAVSRGDLGAARREIVGALWIGGLGAAVCFTLMASPTGSAALQWMFPATAIGSVALLVGVRTGLRVLENIVPEALRAFRHYGRVVLFDGLLTNVAFAGTLAFVLATLGHVALSTVLLIGALASAVTLVPALVSVAGRLRRTPASTDERARRNPIELAMWISTLGRALLAQLDILVIGAIASSREIAMYAAPFRLALMVGLPLLVVNQVITPLMAGWHATGSHDRLERATRTTAGIALLAAIGLAFTFAIGGRLALGLLFGSEYRQAWTVLVILSVGQVLQTWTGSCGFALMMTGQHRVYAVVLFVTAAVTLGLDVAGYELLGLEGVALATAGTLVVQNALQARLVRRRAGFRTDADVRAGVSAVRALRMRHL